MHHTQYKIYYTHYTLHYTLHYTILTVPSTSFNAFFYSFEAISITSGPIIVKPFTLVNSGNKIVTFNSGGKYGVAWASIIVIETYVITWERGREGDEMKEEREMGGRWDD